MKRLTHTMRNLKSMSIWSTRKRVDNCNTVDKVYHIPHRIPAWQDGANADDSQEPCRSCGEDSSDLPEDMGKGVVHIEFEVVDRGTNLENKYVVQLHVRGTAFHRFDDVKSSRHLNDIRSAELLGMLQFLKNHGERLQRCAEVFVHVSSAYLLDCCNRYGDLVTNNKHVPNLVCHRTYVENRQLLIKLLDTLQNYTNILVVSQDSFEATDDSKNIGEAAAEDDAQRKQQIII